MTSMGWMMTPVAPMVQWLILGAVIIAGSLYKYVYIYMSDQSKG